MQSCRIFRASCTHGHLGRLTAGQALHQLFILSSTPPLRHFLPLGFFSVHRAAIVQIDLPTPPSSIPPRHRPQLLLLEPSQPQLNLAAL